MNRLLHSRSLGMLVFFVDRTGGIVLIAVLIFHRDVKSHGQDKE